MPELCFTPAKKLARMIRARRVSASEVVKAFIAQIERVNPKVNAIVTFLPEQAMREARAFNAREFRVLASQPVIDLFLEDESASLAMLSDFIGKPVSIQVETSYGQEQFDIVLM